MPLVLVLAACTADDTPTDPAWTTQVIPAGERRGGDPDAGWEYLVNGDYVGSGVPYDLFTQLLGTVSSDPLDRGGLGATVPYSFNVFDDPNGVSVVGGLNCFGCHATMLDGALVVGLGNAFSDYTEDLTAQQSLVSALITATYGADSPEAEAYAPFAAGAEAIGPYILTPMKGINPAFSMEDAAAAHRDPQTLAWSEDQAWEPIALASDVPPWWNVKKKPALYYPGVGRGDLARLLMQVGMVAMHGRDQAEQIDAHMGDVLAFIDTLEPPSWPYAVDAALAAAGEEVFGATCARCHGTYGATETYPGLLVHVDEVGTDPVYADRFRVEGGLVDWLRASWFAEVSDFVPERAYVAPPLDGIWVTAPYLHNGSVPDLATLLDSAQRPAVFTKTPVYDPVGVGWAWTAGGAAPDAFDTSVAGYGNGGHTYGDALTAADRAAVLEYLKTL